MRRHVMHLVTAAFVGVVGLSLSACGNIDSANLTAPAERSAIVITRPPTSTLVLSQACAGATGKAASLCPMNANAVVSAGTAVTCSLRVNGAPYCWGSNVNGVLGNGSSLGTTTSTPVLVSGGRVYTSISVGYTHACAIDPAGKAFCWGRNDVGQLGIGSQSPAVSTTPVPVSGGRVFTAISAGWGTTCGVSGARVLCWGFGFSNTPAEPGAYSGGSYVDVSVSDGSELHSSNECALSSAGTACVGAGGPGVRMIAQGGTAAHFCMIDAAAITSCWGDDYFGQLGDGKSGAAGWVATSPVLVGGFHSFQWIATGGRATCAIENGVGFCWGRNDYQQLGTGTTQQYSVTPQRVAMPAGTIFTTLAVGDSHACAIDAAGAIWCWGREDSGQAAPPSDSGGPAKLGQAIVLF